MIDETRQSLLEEEYQEKFKMLPPLLFGYTPNNDYYQLLFDAMKRKKPVTPKELEKVFKIKNSNYDLIQEFDEDYDDDITD